MKRLNYAKPTLLIALGVLVAIAALNTFMPVLVGPYDQNGRMLLGGLVVVLALLTARGMLVARIALGIYALAAAIVAGLTVLSLLVVEPITAPLMLIVGALCAFAALMLLRPQAVATWLDRFGARS